MKKTPRYMKFVTYLAVVVLINLVGMTLFFRIDLTANRVYSLSNVSKKVVSSLREPLTINVFFTRNLPAPYNGVEQYLRDLLGEYALSANTYFNYRFYDVTPEGEGGGPGSSENLKLAGSYGINPVQIQVVEKDEMKLKKAYMGLVIIHGDMMERLSTITTTDGLEYKLTTSIQKLNNKISAFINLKDRIDVKLYLSSSLQQIAQHLGVKDLPNVAPNVKKLVESLNARMYGKLNFSVEDVTSEQEMARISKDQNIVMLKWPALENGKIPAGGGLIGLSVSHGNKAFQVPVLQAFQVPLFGTQYKLLDMGTMEEAIEQGTETLIGINQTLGYLADRGTIDLYGQGQPSMNNFTSNISRIYTIKDVTLKAGIPEGLPSLLIVRPTEELSDYDLFQIDQALMKGTSLAVFLDPFKQPPQQAGQFQPGQMVPNITGIEKLLAHYGIKVNQSYVMDEHCYKQQLPEQYGGGEQPLYFAPIIESNTINTALPYMKNIKQLIAFKSAPVDLEAKTIQENKLRTFLLFSSSDRSWEMRGTINLNPMLIRPPGPETPMKKYPLAYIVEGSFPSYFAGKPVPEKPAETEKPAGNPGAPVQETKVPLPAADPTPAGLERKGDVIQVSRPARIFVMASPEMLSDNLIGEQADNPNATFVMNIIDVLNNREDIAMMRGKIQSFNPLYVKDEQMKLFVKGFNIVGLPMLVIAAGLIMWVRRISRKGRIEAIFREKGAAS